MNSKTGATGLENVRGYGLVSHYWNADVVLHQEFVVTSLVQTALDCITRLELLGSAVKRRRVLEVLALADGGSESAGESRSRALIHVLGLPAPELQHTFHDGQGFVARTDIFWPEFGLIEEFDGNSKYLDDELLGGRSTRETILAEKKREDRLRAMGYAVVRWDWKAMTDPQLHRRKLMAAGLTPGKPPGKRLAKIPV